MDMSRNSKMAIQVKNQHGVDIYGTPPGEMQYYGIQYKCKDEYTHKQFSENEIDTAKHFRPSLKKLYLATIAVKDAKIEKYVRLKNIANITEGLFGVYIYLGKTLWS